MYKKLLNILNTFVFKCCNRLEHGVYNISRMRESATKRFKVFQIPVDWLLDSGYATKVIQLSSFVTVYYFFKFSRTLIMLIYAESTSYYI